MMPSPFAQSLDVIVGATHGSPSTRISRLCVPQNNAHVGATRWFAPALRRAVLTTTLTIILCFLSTGFALAQRTITQDEVNAVAERMYCPVCENIPLDDCGTATCQAWKDEIRDQLIAGQSADSIVADFVVRYGEQVVGIPQNPILRALSLITPWIMVGIALLIGVWTFRRWQVRPTVSDTPAIADVKSNAYRSRIEQDVG